MAEAKNSFPFYYNWEDSINELTDPELRSFILNLIHYHQGKEVILATREEKFLWNGILPALKFNEEKYRKRSEASRENGKLGGRPKVTQHNLDNLDNLDNQVGLIETQHNLDNLIKDKGQGILDTGQGLLVTGEGITDNGYLLEDLSVKEFNNLSAEQRSNYCNYISQLEELSHCQRHILKYCKQN